MAKVKAFRALRPSRDKVHLVASRPYQSYTKKQLSAKLKENPYSFIHILQPNFPNTPGRANSLERFRAIRKKYLEFVKDETLITDEKNSFYIYRQIKDKHSYTGIIGCASTDDYENNVIKKHEHTLAKREETFKQYLDECNFNAEPVLMVYEENEAIEDIISRYTHTRAEYDFTSTDRVRHIFWLINDKDHVDEIETAFSKINSIYIADGHHRSASSALLAKERALINPNENATFKGLMSYFIPDTQISILPFHRIFKASTEVELKQKIDAILNKYQDPNGDIFMCVNEFQYCLKLPNNGKGAVAKLASNKVSKHILSDICDVADERNDSRIEHMGGEISLGDFAQHIRKSPLKIGFYLKSVLPEELFRIADNGEFMPPKSTYIEPKLRSGVTILDL